MTYYFLDLKYYVQEQAVTNNYPDIYSGDEVVIEGYLYYDGFPVAGAIITGNYTVKDKNPIQTRTDEFGYFRIASKAPDWEDYGLCNATGNYMVVRAYVDNSEVASENFTCTFRCGYPPPEARFRCDTLNCYIDAKDTVVYPEQILEVPKNATLKAVAWIENIGGYGDISMWVKDETEGRWLQAQTISLNQHERKRFVVTFVPSWEGKHEIRFYACHKEGSELIIDEKTKPFYIQTKPVEVEEERVSVAPLEGVLLLIMIMAFVLYKGKGCLRWRP